MSCGSRALSKAMTRMKTNKSSSTRVAWALKRTLPATHFVGKHHLCRALGLPLVRPLAGLVDLEAFANPLSAYFTASKIRDAYVFIAQNFEAGDQICLFGCVGVWDTVGSIFNTNNALNIADTSLPATVEVALHALSVQENREKFLPTLWTLPSGGLKPGQVLKQIWFPGAHSDVGGGYERHELADISLYWMVGELQSLVKSINLDLTFLRSYAQVRPDPWGTSQPHNTYEGTCWLEKLFVGRETRLESGQIDTEPMFHESNKFTPWNLSLMDLLTILIPWKPSPINLLTIYLTLAWKHRWSPLPHIAPLNSFEQQCKDDWGNELTVAPPGGIKSPVN
ncbi:hypothetical protein V5O48_009438 [Marasmius crinis-equi]|uniref:T6SS Phospholipase effector Tle1-like catalytic domain-containing protein n=1 Tax=Marasmius crinis-equi TaxID=585013 RepID=A0ABR3FB78_9AGAR